MTGIELVGIGLGLALAAATFIELKLQLLDHERINQAILKPFEAFADRYRQYTSASRAAIAQTLVAVHNIVQIAVWYNGIGILPYTLAAVVYTTIMGTTLARSYHHADTSNPHAVETKLGLPTYAEVVSEAMRTSTGFYPVFSIAFFALMGITAGSFGAIVLLVIAGLKPNPPKRKHPIKDAINKLKTLIPSNQSNPATI